MDSSDPSTGQHCHNELYHHGHVYPHSVPLTHTWNNRGGGIFKKQGYGYFVSLSLEQT